MREKVGKRVLEEGRRRRRAELINGGGDALRYIIMLADSFANKSLTVCPTPAVPCLTLFCPRHTLVSLVPWRSQHTEIYLFRGLWLTLVFFCLARALASRGTHASRRQKCMCAYERGNRVRNAPLHVAKSRDRDRGELRLCKKTKVAGYGKGQRELHEIRVRNACRSSI